MFTTLLAQEATTTPPAQQGSLFSMALPFILMIGVFYLLIIRPQQKQKKEMQNMLNSLKVNDKVLTSSGIFGKVVDIEDDKGTVLIRIDEKTNTKVIFQKSSIINVIGNEGENG